MGLVKKNLFTDKQNEMADLFKAIGHPARIAILEHLIKSDACINTDLVGVLGLAQSTVSQHLKELKNIGLIQGTIEGPRMSYCINPEVWNQYIEVINAFWGQKDINNQCC